ncbi:MAG: glycosyltransferase family 9 protein [Desulfarculaceae bacterium]|nr:glycosyltransferase family 9 protein [Desulfarculaceae bacterium]MCF8121725.1 glycosyltransferase family 9 protein [Desulfarculaceae bacterium]
MIRKLKTIVRHLIYALMNRLIRPSCRIGEKSLLLVRIDLIGDYVLFRNFIQALKQDPQYQGYQFTLLGNSAWRDLFEKLDAKFCEEVIWLDLERFNRSLVYRFQKLREITRQGYEVVVSPVYSRDFWNVDSIVKLVRAREKIGSAGDFSNLTMRQKRRSDRYYTRLLPAAGEVVFEFNRNREFFENLLNRPLPMTKPEIAQQPSGASFDPSFDYAVFFIGGSSVSKKWGLGNFAQVGRHLLDNYGLEIVLCGAASDRPDAEALAQHLDFGFTDLVGKTSLWELAQVVAKAGLMLSNDTMAPHLAAALGKDKVFVVYSGNYYGRCLPYPRETSQGVHVICHPQIRRDPQAFKAASNAYGYVNRLDINRISPESVIDEIDEVLLGQARAEAEDLGRCVA